MTLTVDPRFCGPPTSANGGYFAGLVAQSLPGPVEVTLRLPPPLAAPMTVTATETGVDVEHEGRVVAQARTSDPGLDLAPPEPVSLAQAEQAASRYIFAEQGHPFPTCFVCGPHRERGDGLRIFPGPLAGGVAGTWLPDETLAGADGLVRPEFLWSALDCPSFFGAIEAGYASTEATVLGRITAQLHAQPPVGEALVVQAWGVEGQGRRSVAGSALFTGAGELVALARAVWVRLA